MKLSKDKLTHLWVSRVISGQPPLHPPKTNAQIYQEQFNKDKKYKKGALEKPLSKWTRLLRWRQFDLKQNDDLFKLI